MCYSKELQWQLEVEGLAWVSKQHHPEPDPVNAGSKTEPRVSETTHATKGTKSNQLVDENHERRTVRDVITSMASENWSFSRLEKKTTRISRVGDQKRWASKEVAASEATTAWAEVASILSNGNERKMWALRQNVVIFWIWDSKDRPPTKGPGPHMESGAFSLNPFKLRYTFIVFGML